MHAFTDPEILEGDNGFGCIQCTKTEMLKQGLEFDESLFKDTKEMKKEEELEISSMTLYYCTLKCIPTNLEIENRAKDKSSKKKLKKEKPKLVKCPAIKQFLLEELPPILTLHLKRFKQTNYGFEKINKNVKFPLVLDLTNYLASPPIDPTKSIYHLFGMVVHGGSLNGGHYVAYVKKTLKENGDDASEDKSGISQSKWFYFSDSSFKQVGEHDVLNEQAYILFYQRRTE